MAPNGCVRKVVLFIAVFSWDTSLEIKMFYTHGNKSLSGFPIVLDKLGNHTQTSVTSKEERVLLNINIIT